MTNGNPLAGRDLLRLLDLTPEEFELVLDTAAQQKADWAAGIHEAPCKDESVAIILEKPSLRTRSSFEIGTYRLRAPVKPLRLAELGALPQTPAAVFAVTGRTPEQHSLEEEEGKNQ